SVFGAGRTADAFRSTVVDGLMKWPYSGVKKIEDVKVDHLMACAKCHLPQLEDATDDVAREIVGVIIDWQKAATGNDQAAAQAAARKLDGLNIGCLICHNRNAVIHKWADGYPKAGEVYGTREGAAHAQGLSPLRRSPVMGESIMCGQCHGLGPNLDLENPTQCSTVYGSYLYSYKAHGGTASCQDCHMRQHNLGHDMTANHNPGVARESLDVSTETHGFFWRDDRQYLPRLIVDVTMVNKAGHSIPDSLSPDHRLVLSVTARTRDGEQVFSQTRTYMPIPQRLGRGNKMARGAYEKTGIVEDTALLPLRPVREKFDIVMNPVEAGKDAGAKLATEVTVDVMIRLHAPRNASAEGVTWYQYSKNVKIEEM
ncbi:MAG: multiheme c-type cytochrome (seleno)protein ExtKL, partial [Deltaproteobacteria bacterium]